MCTIANFPAPSRLACMCKQRARLGLCTANLAACFHPARPHPAGKNYDAQQLADSVSGHVAAWKAKHPGYHPERKDIKFDGPKVE